jgi:flagellar protein FlgJ
MTPLSRTPSVTNGAPTAAEQARDARLAQSVRDLEGVFVEQLFKAMRETVPDEGLTSGGSGEEMFTTLMDQHLSAEVPQTWDRGIGEALYRQLREALDTQKKWETER